jgi:hypothetical protein
VSRKRLRPAKQAALDSISRRPDAADKAAILYWIEVIDKVSKGHRTTSEALRREIGQW